MTLSFLEDEANKESVEGLIDLALKEDIKDGDHTSLATIKKGSEGQGVMLAKEDGWLAGIELAEFIYSRIDENISIERFKSDGDGIRNGEQAFRIKGSVRSILKGERLILNFIQYLSGVTTKTRRLVRDIESYNTELMDTRKTTPGLRHLEKWATKLGGAVNHRMGLYDAFLIKDNHIDHAGGIELAINRAIAYASNHDLPLPIIVETRSIEEVKAALNQSGVTRILLDNMDLTELAEAVKLISGAVQTEASGGINPADIRAIAAMGVDYISMSALNRDIHSLDFSLKLDSRS